MEEIPTLCEKFRLKTSETTAPTQKGTVKRDNSESNRVPREEFGSGCNQKSLFLIRRW